MSRQGVTKGSLRRSQLIAPFGVGAMVVVKDGTSLIAAGLDHWFEPPDRSTDDQVDDKEFIVHEWRLAKALNVSHFRLPPDYREHWGFGARVPNAELTIPYLRFPIWYYCTSCHSMQQVTLTTQSRPYCTYCWETKKRRKMLVQVPVIALCENGHIQDFPWREWVHNTLHPNCEGRLTLRATGGATLAAQRVECTACGAVRTLAQVTSAELLIGTGNSAEPLACEGHRPWLGQGGVGTHACGQKLRGSLRTASNVYFAQVKSAIYLPRGTEEVPDHLLELLSTPRVKAVLSLGGGQVAPETLQQAFPSILGPYSRGALAQAMKIIAGGAETAEEKGGQGEEAQEAKFRRAEFEALCEERLDDRDQQWLRVRSQDRTDYQAIVSDHFSKIMLADKLRETRALIGFTRVYAEPGPVESLKVMLRREPLSPGEDWLPAYVVHGEGMFLVVDEERLRDWEDRHDVQSRVEPLQRRYQELQKKRRLRDRTISPRFVMLHTLAHLVMNRLTFDCGYSSASLRERLYVSTDKKRPMAGILIYTAAGDSEGTMGGLVRMGKPGTFESVLLRALQGARWCSADPVCMEMGGSSGQGPNSLNLAACHNCGLVPETACEEFNTFLDRALVVGELANPGLGFFHL